MVAGFHSFDFGFAGEASLSRRRNLGTNERHKEASATRGVKEPSAWRGAIVLNVRDGTRDSRIHCAHIDHVGLSALDGAMVSCKWQQDSRCLQAAMRLGCSVIGSSPTGGVAGPTGCIRSLNEHRIEG